MLKLTGSGEYINHAAEVARKYPKMAERDRGYVVVRGYGVLLRDGDGEQIMGFAETDQEAEKLARDFMEGDKEAAKQAKETANASKGKRSTTGG
jgi:hypothetical protein